MLRRALLGLSAFAVSGILMTSVPPAARAEGLAGPYLAAEQAARRGDISEAARLYARVLVRDPDNVRLMEQTMLHQVAAGQIAQAVVVARRLERTQPGHHLGLLILATDGLKDEKFRKTAEKLEESGANGGPFVGAIIEAWASFAADGIEAARPKLARLESDGAGGPLGKLLAAYHLGLMEAANGDDAAAAVALGRAAEASNNGGTNRLILTRAGALARSGDVDQARALVEERLTRTLRAPRLQELIDDFDKGNVPEPQITTAQAGAADALYAISGFISQGNSRLIGLAYARLAAYLDPELVEAQLLVADILAQDEQFGLAIEAYARIPEGSPEAIDAQIGRAEALRDADEVEEGLSVLREVVLRHPHALEAHIALGDMLRRSSRFDEAAVAYDGAIALIGEPEQRHWVLFYQRGIAHERSKQWPKAEADFLKALELEEDQPLVLNYLGYSWVEMRLNLEEAQSMIERAVEQRPEDGYIVDSLGWVLYRLGKYDEALDHMARAVELRPVDPTINDHYGDVLWVNGRQTEAEFQWKRALSFDPEEEGQADRIKRKLDVGLDQVLKEEAEENEPALVGTEAAEGDDG
ncbi:MAG: tetratricopeptide repeat protein [Pseudomonadota bacterium]